MGQLVLLLRSGMVRSNARYSSLQIKGGNSCQLFVSVENEGAEEFQGCPVKPKRRQLFGELKPGRREGGEKSS